MCVCYLLIMCQKRLVYCWFVHKTYVSKYFEFLNAPIPITYIQFSFNLNLKKNKIKKKLLYCNREKWSHIVIMMGSALKMWCRSPIQTCYNYNDSCNQGKSEFFCLLHLRKPRLLVLSENNTKNLCSHAHQRGMLYWCCLFYSVFSIFSLFCQWIYSI